MSKAIVFTAMAFMVSFIAIVGPINAANDLALAVSGHVILGTWKMVGLMFPLPIVTFFISVKLR